MRGIAANYLGPGWADEEEGAILELDRIATRTIGDSFERLTGISRRVLDRVGPGYIADGPSLTYQAASDLVDEARATLEYAREHLRYLKDEQDDEAVDPPEPFQKGDPVLVDTGEDHPEPARVIQVEQYQDGSTGVLVRFEKRNGIDDEPEHATFALEHVKAVAV